MRRRSLQSPIHSALNKSIFRPIFTEKGDNMNYEAINKYQPDFLPFTDKDFLESEIASWKYSRTRSLQIKGTLYYKGEHDILNRRRTVIGEKGIPEEITNLPNNKTVYNLYAKMVSQKANYLLGKPFVLQSDNPLYTAALKTVFDREFMRILKTAGKAALNGGIAWLYPYFDDENKLRFRVFPAYEILPFWVDDAHTEAQAAIRLYQVETYEGRTPVLREKVELYTQNGVCRFILENGKLLPDTALNQSPLFLPYAVKKGVKTFEITKDKAAGGAYSWRKLPLIPIKSCESEIPLLKKVKSLQDGLNLMLSDFENNMQEDARNTILVLKNYDGTNLGEFRRNLAEYGAVKVRCDHDSQGGVDTLEVNVNPENYKTIISLLKNGIVENAMGFSLKDGLSGGQGDNSPNQLNIKSMYTDIDLDAGDMETELHSSFQKLFPFVNTYLYLSGKGNFEKEKAEIIFNRDMLINETEAINNCISSLKLLSEETAVTQHPWVNDPYEELNRIKNERSKNDI